MRIDGPKAPERPACPSPRGTTLPELLLVLVLLGILGTTLLHAFGVFDRISLARSADLVQGHLVRARLEALARRQKVEVRGAGPGRLLLVDGAGRLIADVDLAGEGLLALDSVRIRPSVIRYNPRGQGSAGSVTLYRGRRGVRLVSNFLGRVRRHAFRF